MLSSIDELEKGFKRVSEKSKKECGEKLEEIRQLSYLSHTFFLSLESFENETKEESARWRFLYQTSLLELFRISGIILFLSANGLYRNAFDNIRHAMELIVQAVYIDSRHPDVSLSVKVEILKEIEGKREYRALNLIEQLKIAHKDKLKAEYKELSSMIHPSHRQIVTLIRDVASKEHEYPVTVDSEEISKIFESMKGMYDIFFFLILSYSSELAQIVKKDSGFCDCVKSYALRLVAGVMEVRF
jgi:hypothetical protein